ncbi:pyruvate dehydrogenase (acetyl-transferring) kinase, mitochondrial [Tanacetum coccineum]
MGTDNPGTTMEEYIQFETERALKIDKDYDWETAKYGMVNWHLDDVDINILRIFDTKFPAIVYNDALKLKPDLSFEPTLDSHLAWKIMLRVFPMSLTGAANRWLRNKPAGSIDTWETLKKKFLSKYCPPARTAKKMEEINNFQQEPDETLYQAWERLKELLLRCPQHYLTDMQEDCPLKEGKTLEEAYYNQLGVPFPQGGIYRATTPGFYPRDSGNPSYQERRQIMEELLSKFIVESAKRHDVNSNLIKEIRAAIDAAIRNQ